MRILLIIILSVITTTLYGQDYRTAVGVRGGFPTALSLKHFIKKDAAVEGLVSGYRGGFEITGLYEIHANAFDIPYLQLYYGAGGHVGLFDDNIARPGFYYNTRETGFAIGLDGIIGIEYTLTEIPFVLAFDLKPSLDLAPSPVLWMGGGITVRFYFAK